jgi:hypothetical protein
MSALPVIGFAALAALSPPPAAAQQDVVTVVSVTPSDPVTRGVEVEFTFEIDVIVGSANDAMVELGFNSDRPNSWKIVAQQTVQRGGQRVVLKAVVIPVDWRERGRFSALINIAPPIAQRAGSYTPTASVSHPIEVIP